MAPAAKMRPVAPGILHGERFSPRLKAPMGGYLLEDEDGPVLVDPFLPEGEEEPSWSAAWRSRGRPKAVLLTTPAHLRRIDRLVEACGRSGRGPVVLASPEACRELARRHPEASAAVRPWSPSVTSGSNPSEGGGSLPGGLRPFPVEGAGAGECLLWRPREGGQLFVGDAVLNLPGKDLGLLYPPHCRDPETLRASILTFLDNPDLPFRQLFPGHGDPILQAARARLRERLSGGAHDRPGS